MKREIRYLLSAIAMLSGVAVIIFGSLDGKDPGGAEYKDIDSVPESLSRGMASWLAREAERSIINGMMDDADRESALAMLFDKDIGEIAVARVEDRMRYLSNRLHLHSADRLGFENSAIDDPYEAAALRMSGGKR